MTEHYDIVVCGGGVVGLTLANLLNSERLSVLLLDAGRQPEPPQQTQPPTRQGFELNSGFTPRISVLNANSVDLLRRCGVTVDRTCEFSTMQIWDGEGTAHIEFRASDLGSDHLGMVIENQRIVHGLYQRLVAAEQVTMKFEQTVEDLVADDLGTRLVLEDDSEVTASLVVGADGGQSTVRRLSGIRATGWKYDETAIVCTIETDLPHASIPRQWFTADGPLAFLPLPEPNLCSIVWSHRNANKLLELKTEDFCQALTEASEASLGPVLGADPRFTFPLRQQHAIQYGRPGVLLIGDAAHAIHPLAGQGANLGLSDADVLAREINQTILVGDSPGDASVLRRYAAARQPQNLAMGAAMEVFKHAYRSNLPVVGWLRNQAMHFTNQSDYLKRLIMKLAAGQL